MWGKAPSSQPMMKTAPYSSPFALWSVISVTFSLSAPSSASCSERSMFVCRYSSSAEISDSPSNSRSRSNSAAPSTSASRFSARPSASTVRSAASASR